MNSEARKNATCRFAARQAILLLTTVVLVAFFTIPLLKAVKVAMNPGQLQANLDEANNEVVGLQTKTDVVRSKMLMGAGDDEAQEKLRKEVEELKRQVAAKEKENKNLQEQMALVGTMLEMVKAKPVATPVPVVATSHTFFDLLTKIFGCIGSAFTGGMFVVSWWRNRREPPRAAEG